MLKNLILSFRTALSFGVLCGFFVANAQAPEIEWQRCVGGSSSEFAYAIQATPDGGAVVAGFTQSNNGDVTGNHGDRDYWLVRLDPEGELLWQKCYGGSTAETATVLVNCNDGGFLLIGSTNSIDGDVDCTEPGYSSIWVLKTTADGTLEWKSCIDAGASSNIFSAASAPEGGWVLAGSTLSNTGLATENHGFSDFFVVKISDFGAVEWAHCYGGSGHETATVICHQVQEVMLWQEPPLPMMAMLQRSDKEKHG